MNQAVRAELKYLRIPPRKARFVADIIKGLPVQEAEAQLIQIPRRPAEHLLKLLRSAVANAKNNHKLAPENLYVKEIRVDSGPRLKRFWPRAFGRVNLIEKKMSHVTLILGVAEKPAAPRFVIQEKPKKEKPAKESKKPQKEKDEFKKEKAAETKKTEKAGFFKRIFRRKSV